MFQALIYDIIRKYLKKSGYDITYARNYTDVDDKIIANANKLGIDPKIFAEQKIEVFIFFNIFPFCLVKCHLFPRKKKRKRKKNVYLSLLEFTL